MKLRTWTLALLIALAAALLAVTATATASSRTRSGLRIVLSWGPVCYPAKHYCTRYKLKGWKAALLRGGRIVAQGTTSSAGTVTLFAPPGRYSYSFSGLYGGHRYTEHGAGVPVLPGQILPFYYGIS